MKCPYCLGDDTHIIMSGEHCCYECVREFYDGEFYFWTRLETVVEKYLKSHWNRSLVISVSIYDLRKIDRGIDHVLRNILKSKEYGNRVRLYGAPSGQFGRHPFKDNEGKIWHSVRLMPIKSQE